MGGGRLSSADDFYHGWLRNAEAHIKKRQYGAAIVEYSKALKIKMSKSCLLARARCHMILGDVAKAHADAEKVLEDDHEYTPGLLALAEIYFVMGKLNQSRLYYARGHKLRPSNKLFQEGIRRVDERVREIVENPKLATSQDWGAQSAIKPPCIVRTPLYDSTSTPRFGTRAT
eukprot:tig00021537_g22264.t1